MCLSYLFQKVNSVSVKLEDLELIADVLRTEITTLKLAFLDELDSQLKQAINNASLESLLFNLLDVCNKFELSDELRNRGIIKILNRQKEIKFSFFAQPVVARVMQNYGVDLNSLAQSSS